MLGYTGTTQTDIKVWAGNSRQAELVEVPAGTPVTFTADVGPGQLQPARIYGIDVKIEPVAAMVVR